MKEFAWKVAAYEYSDLTEKAKEVVKEWYLEGQDSYMFTELVQTDMRLVFPHSELDVEYSLSYCQGDGLNVYGTLYFEDMIRILKDKFNETEISVLTWIGSWMSGWKLPSNHRSAYCICDQHDYAEDIVWELENAGVGNIPVDLINKFGEEVSEYMRDYCQSWEKAGYQYFYEADDSTVEEWCCANEYWFDESGNIIATGDEELKRFVVHEIGSAICDFIYEVRV